MHKDAHLSYKWYKVYKTLFQWPSEIHKYQCTQNTHCFCIFFLFFNFFIWKTKQSKIENNKNNNLLNKAKHKTRLTQNKDKTHKLCKNKNSKRKKKVIESLGVLFLPHLERTFPLIKSLNQWWGGRIETVQIQKEHEGFEKISKRSKRGLKLILVLRCYHVVALLSG